LPSISARFPQALDLLLSMSSSLLDPRHSRPCHRPGLLPSFPLARRPEVPRTWRLHGLLLAAES
jgi:hypothetical protein